MTPQELGKTFIEAVVALNFLSACAPALNPDPGRSPGNDNRLTVSTLCLDGSGKTIPRPSSLPLPAGTLCDIQFGLPTGQRVVMTENTRQISIAKWDGFTIEESRTLPWGSFNVVDKNGTRYDVNPSNQAVEVKKDDEPKPAAGAPAVAKQPTAPTQAEKLPTPKSVSAPIMDKTPTVIAKPTVRPATPVPVPDNPAANCKGIKIPREEIIGCPPPFTIYEGGTRPVYVDAKGTTNRVLRINPEKIAQIIRSSGNTTIREVHINWRKDAAEIASNGCGNAGLACFSYSLPSMLYIFVAREVNWDYVVPGGPAIYDSNQAMYNAMILFELSRLKPQYATSGDIPGSPLERDLFWKRTDLDFFSYLINDHQPMEHVTQMIHDVKLPLALAV